MRTPTDLSSAFPTVSKAVMQRRGMLVSVPLVAAGLAAYGPVRHAQFTNFDDNVYISANPEAAHGLTCHGVVWALTTVHRNNWHP